METKGILNQQLIDGRAARIGWPALRQPVFAISLRINVIPAAWQQNALHTSKQSRHTTLTLVKRDKNRRRSSGVQSGKISRQGALVIGGIAAGRLGDGNVNAHGSNSVITLARKR
jgi:hypothetical protein